MISTMQIALDFGLEWMAYREPTDGRAPEKFGYGTSEEAAIAALLRSETEK
jgi:hypothetical protein